MTPNLHAKDRKNFLAPATALVSTIFALPFTAYARKVLGRDLVLYQALVVFKSGSAHACAILNAGGGRICVIDPAGHYLTSDGVSATAKPALQELENYSALVF
jgi:hypothetical protein